MRCAQGGREIEKEERKRERERGGMKGGGYVAKHSAA